MRTVYLFGNGIMVAFRRDQFELGQLTCRVRALLEGVTIDDGESVWSRLEELSAAVRSDPSPGEPPVTGDFEKFAGPLERLATAIAHLDPLLKASHGIERSALRALEADVRALYHRAVGAVLKAVTDNEDSSERSNAVSEVARIVGDALLRPPDTDIFTLNYDAWLDHALLDRGQQSGLRVSDEFDGRTPSSVVVRGRQIETHEWRTERYSPPERHIRLHHLHGAANWIVVEGQVRKARLDDLRQVGLFDEWIAGYSLNCEPAVVLGDHKQRLVARAPFGETYADFRAALGRAGVLVVAGYSFRDVPVNLAIAGALQPDAQIYVVDPDPRIVSTAAKATLIRENRWVHVSLPLPEGLEKALRLQAAKSSTR